MSLARHVLLVASLFACAPPPVDGTATATATGGSGGATTSTATTEGLTSTTTLTGSSTSTGSSTDGTSTSGATTGDVTTGGSSTDATTTGVATTTGDAMTTDETTGVVDPEDCNANPIPWCKADTMPTPNGVPTPPPGLGGCPPGMARVDTFCIDRWEAALVEVLAGDELGPWSPHRSPAGAQVRAVSAPDLVPQGYISQLEASAACAAAGKRLCSDLEWLRACQGAMGHVFPYGDALEPGVCNDARACHPAIQYFESVEPWIWSELDHPCLNQLPAGLDPTGANPGCVSDDGIFDMMGNLHEWTDDPAGTFRGGYYVDTKINGMGCLYLTTAHAVTHWDYSTGFRCCAD